MVAPATVALAVAALGAGGIGATWASVRRWAANPDPLDGPPLHLPDGEHSILETTDGAKLEVTVAGAGGSGRTVVMAHCWTGDRRVWGHVARRLVDRGHPVVLYDHRGHGGSVPGADPITLAVLARDLREVLDHVDARDAVLAGHSMGGMTVQTYAIDHAEHRRERVSALVLVTTACAGLDPGRGFGRFAVRAVTDDRRQVLLQRGPGRLVGARRVFGRQPALAHIEAALETFRSTAGVVRGACLASMLEMDLRGGLAGVETPAVVVAGERDRLVPRRHSHAIARHLPGARLHVIPDAGHMLPFERPEELADLIAGAGT